MFRRPGASARLNAADPAHPHASTPPAQPLRVSRTRNPFALASRFVG
ncbi:MAG: hypothetical protein QOF53_903 [Nocardioidaceae bacterium]|jgi:hypothetical protein|nr:hypothetical protein [Nocardioidaceae bacterium]